MATGETHVASYFSSGASATRFFGGGPGAGDLQRQRGSRFDARRRKVVGSGESPAAESQHANAHACRFASGDVAHLAVLGGDFLFADFDRANVGVGDAAARDGIQRVAQIRWSVIAVGNRRPPSYPCSPAAGARKSVEYASGYFRPDPVL